MTQAPATGLWGPELTIDVLKKYLSYDPLTGVFHRLCDQWQSGVKAGDDAGQIDDQGYIRVKVRGKKYRGHRLAWFYQYGSWPDGPIDHINRVRTDNRIENLRVTDAGGNAHNASIRKDNKTGLKGVSFDLRDNMYKAQIMHKNIPIKLGKFLNIEDAKRAYYEASIKYHGEFSIITQEQGI